MHRVTTPIGRSRHRTSAAGRRATLRPVDQDQLASRVLERLEDEASRGTDAWVPVVGWMQQPREPYGLATELFGSEPPAIQLGRLGRAIARLAYSGRVEIARFVRPRTPTLALTGSRGPTLSPCQLIGPGSDPLGAATSAGWEYGVRLANRR